MRDVGSVNPGLTCDAITLKMPLQSVARLCQGVIADSLLQIVYAAAMLIDGL
jgi:hypothetical protein